MHVEQFEEKLPLEFETLLNGEKIHRSEITGELPLREQFKDTAEYYSTAFHEIIHSTAHISRLNRLEKTAYQGHDHTNSHALWSVGATKSASRKERRCSKP